MAQSIPIIEARSRLTKLPEEFGRHPGAGAVAVTRRGKPVLAVLSWDLYESLLETLEILSDEDMVSSLRRSLREAAAGKVIRWDRAKKRLGL